MLGLPMCLRPETPDGGQLKADWSWDIVEVFPRMPCLRWQVQPADVIVLMHPRFYWNPKNSACVQDFRTETYLSSH